MSRSPYIDNVILTNKHSGRRTHKVQAFVIHHMAARWTGKQCALYFRDTPGRQASTNYAIGYDGDVALNVEEHNRAWTSGSNWADQRAITFELANSAMGHPWKVSDKTIDKTIVMLAELHKRYGLKEASYTGNTNGTLWRHDWFQSTNCPGPYLGGKLSYIADEVNKILRGEKRAPAASQAPLTSTSSSSSDAKLVKYENGTFTVTDPLGIKVRNAPSTKATHTGDLEKGNSIVYDRVYEGNGYRWLSYVSYSGARLYVPYRPSNDIDNQWGTFSTAEEKKDPNQFVSGAELVKYEDGTFTVADSAGIKVRSNPTTHARHTGTLPQGASIVYDRVYEGNGYRWLSYIGGSGNRLYVPYRPSNNVNNQWGRFS